MSAALIDAGNGLIEAYDGGAHLNIERAKAAWAEAVAAYDAEAEDLDFEDGGSSDDVDLSDIGSDVNDDDSGDEA